jgi:hypothetical protein
MGNLIPCYKPTTQKAKGEPTLSLNLEELKIRSALRLICRIYREYRYLYSIKDIPFIEQKQTLSITNEIVKAKMTELPPFKFNRVLSKVPRELRKPTSLQDGSIYSGYWYIIH